MLTWEQKQDLAGQILDFGKKLTPDRFPQISAEVIDVWAEVIGEIHVPPAVWRDAVKLWATELVGDRMCTPRELKHAARTVLARWETHPVRGPQLRAHRDELTAQRDRQLAAGTFGQTRGYTPIEAPKSEPHTDIANVYDIATRLKNNLKRQEETA